MSVENTDELNATRLYCVGCRLLCRHCLCEFVQALPSKTQLLILQYSKEAKHSKNTVQLLRLTVPNCHIVVANDFNFMAGQRDYQAILQANPMLLYPNASSVELTQNLSQENADYLNARAELPKTECLVLIDASWKKSKKIFHSTQWLAKLATYHLEKSLIQAPSIYAIRKKKHDYFRSTFEAALLSLQVLESYPISSGYQLLQQFCLQKQQDQKTQGISD